MILDIETYNATSYGSARKILCRCDACGVECMAIKQHLVKRGGYRKCQRCSVTKDGLSKAYIETKCKDCGLTQKRRADALLNWAGRCRSCASKDLATRPEIKEAMRQNGIKVMARVGKLPHYPRNYRSGPASNKWRGGITPENQRIRGSLEMKVWRKAVFERDDYTCTICGDRGGDKHADHIKPFALHPELRFEASNGRTLCVPCHRQYGAMVCNGKITREPVFKIAAEG